MTVGCGGLQPSERTLDSVLFYDLAESHQTQQDGLNVSIGSFGTANAKQ